MRWLMLFGHRRRQPVLKKKQVQRYEYPDVRAAISIRNSEKWRKCHTGRHLRQQMIFCETRKAPRRHRKTSCQTSSAGWSTSSCNPKKRKQRKCASASAASKLGKGQVYKSGVVTVASAFVWPAHRKISPKCLRETYDGAAIRQLLCKQNSPRFSFDPLCGQQWRFCQVHRVTGAGSGHRHGIRSWK